MDIREFSNKLAEATKNMSPEEKASLMKMFESVSQEIGKEDTKKRPQRICASILLRELRFRTA